MKDQENAFLATVRERFCLNPGSEKETYHLILDLDGSGIEYKVGDCLGVFPQNDPSLVKEQLEKLGATGSELIQDRKGKTFVLNDFLIKRASLSRLPKDSGLPLQPFCQKLAPLTPRFYSIASSMEVVGTTAHLTVGLVPGTCSHYLCKQVELGKPILPVFHHPSRNFALSSTTDDKPIIMIGPGTGIAPFRGFVQHRLAKKQSSKNWLFFGERHSKTDFYYKPYWEDLVQKGQLVLDTAFSRDQNERIYVQHRMLEKSKQLWSWIEEGAYLFVCGDASNMAKDVDKVLHQIAQQEGLLSQQDAKLFLKNLKKEGRYQRDVY